MNELFVQSSRISLSTISHIHFHLFCNNCCIPNGFQGRKKCIVPSRMKLNLQSTVVLLYSYDSNALLISRENHQRMILRFPFWMNLIVDFFFMHDFEIIRKNRLQMENNIWHNRIFYRTYFNLQLLSYYNHFILFVVL